MKYGRQDYLILLFLGYSLKMLDNTILIYLKRKLRIRRKSFLKNRISNIYPAHCVDDYAFRELEKTGGQRLKTLRELSF